MDFKAKFEALRLFDFKLLFEFLAWNFEHHFFAVRLDFLLHLYRLNIMEILSVTTGEVKSQIILFESVDFS